MGAMRLSIYNRTSKIFSNLSPQRTFILLLLFSSISLLVWAGIAEVDVIVRTEGQIIPAGKSQIVQHLEVSKTAEDGRARALAIDQVLNEVTILLRREQIVMRPVVDRLW